MKSVLEHIQDSIKVKDTAKKIKAVKIIPLTKIKSKDGAIIPKEAISWIEIQPAINKEEDERTPITSYILYGIAIIFILVVLKIVLNRIKSK